MTETEKRAFDPLDMRNYSLEKFREIKAGPVMQRMKLIGVPLAVLVFLIFQWRWCGTIDLFESQTLF